MIHELKNQIASISNCIDNIIAKENELSDWGDFIKNEFDFEPVEVGGVDWVSFSGMLFFSGSS